MSKKSISKRKEQRKREKKARKEANKRKYEEYKRQGINTKSRRAKRNTKAAKKIALIKHPQIPCGNIACKTCYPNI